MNDASFSVVEQPNQEKSRKQIVSCDPNLLIVDYKFGLKYFRNADNMPAKDELVHAAQRRYFRESLAALVPARERKHANVIGNK